MLSRHIKAAAECSAGSQNPKDFPISGILIRESVKAVQRQNDVKGAVHIGKSAHISLPEGYIFQSQSVCLFLCLPHHIGRIIKAGNVCLRHSLINRHGKNARSDRHLKQFTREIFGNTRQRFFKIIVTFRFVHTPHQAAHCFSAQSGAGYHTVIKIIAARYSVRTANGVLSFHIHSSESLFLLLYSHISF